MKKILFLLVLSASFFIFQMNCFASITLTGNTADIKITAPGDTKAADIKAGESIPTIEDGSTIEILNNDITVAATAPSAVNLSMGENAVYLVSGNTVEIGINTNGAIKVHSLQGTVSIKTAEGKTISLKEGETVILTKKKADNAEPYTPPANNLGPVNTGVQIEEKAPDISPVS
jgi:hypothetical protein